MMTMTPIRHCRLWVLAIVVIALAAASSAASQAATVAATQPVVRGAIYNLEGYQAVLDKPSFKGARLAVEEANQTEGVLGRPVRLILEYGESDSEMVRRKTSALIERDPSVSALLGLSDTDMVLAAGPLAAENQR
ncbi:MAG: ABC transporter substrate-binding protein [Pseudomonadota bacterium]|nr:ABC transporter substrate-binding protein [Pseudomonadota bacterium]